MASVTFFTCVDIQPWFPLHVLCLLRSNAVKSSDGRASLPREPSLCSAERESKNGSILPKTNINYYHLVSSNAPAVLVSPARRYSGLTTERAVSTKGLISDARSNCSRAAVIPSLQIAMARQKAKVGWPKKIASWD